MARESEITSRELSRQLLLARCELDRRELRAEIHTLGSNVRRGVERVRGAVPWLLIAAPVAGLVTVRFLKLRRLAGLLVVLRMANRLRPWLPVIVGALGSRTRGGTGGRA